MACPQLISSHLPQIRTCCMLPSRTYLPALHALIFSHTYMVNTITTQMPYPRTTVLSSVHKSHFKCSTNRPCEQSTPLRPKAYTTNYRPCDQSTSLRPKAYTAIYRPCDQTTSLRPKTYKANIALATNGFPYIRMPHPKSSKR